MKLRDQLDKIDDKLDAILNLHVELRAQYDRDREHGQLFELAVNRRLNNHSERLQPLERQRVAIRSVGKATTWAMGILAGLAAVITKIKDLW